MFNFARRINRRTYWVGTAIFNLSLLLFVLVLFMYPFNEEKSGVFEPFPDIPLIIYLLVVFTYSICLLRQRANDVSARPLLALFLTLMVPAGTIIIGFLPGMKTSNKFGPPPVASIKLR
jgi:uncharacterized membrane protein YhaH (DUF805 family)